jgi:hypothetical protein
MSTPTANEWNVFKAAGLNTLQAVNEVIVNSNDPVIDTYAELADAILGDCEAQFNFDSVEYTRLCGMSEEEEQESYVYIDPTCRTWEVSKVSRFIGGDIIGEYPTWDDALDVVLGHNNQLKDHFRSIIPSWFLYIPNSTGVWGYEDGEVWVEAHLVGGDIFALRHTEGEKYPYRLRVLRTFGNDAPYPCISERYFKNISMLGDYLAELVGGWD